MTAHADQPNDPGQLRASDDDRNAVARILQTASDEGRITPDEAESHPQRHMVTRVLTGQPSDEPDLAWREISQLAADPDESMSRMASKWLARIA